MTTTPAPTDLDTAVDAAARAIQAYQARTAVPPEQYTWDAIPQEWRDRHLAAARVMVEAAMTPLLAELAKTRAELATMTAVAKSNKSVTENMAQELIKALSLLADYVDGEYPHARAKRLLAENLDVNPATTAEPAEGADMDAELRKASGGVVTNPPAVGQDGCIVPTWRLEGTREISDAEREAFARVEHMLQPIDPNRPPVHIRDFTQPSAS